MSKKLRLILLLTSILIMISLACNLPFNIGSKDKNAPPTVSSGETDLPILPELATSTPTAPDPKPVSFQDGFGSLDSYKFTLHIESSKSDGSSTIIDEILESSVADENNHTIMTTSTRSEDGSDDSNETTETYNIGTVTCTLSDGEWEYSSKTVQEKEISDIFSQMIDFVPVIKNPLFVGEENVNGVQSNHFTFSISGIGEKSGAVATKNQGDYWLAVDGQYIVRYTLDLQVQSAPADSSGAEVSTMVVKYDLTEVNVPILLSQPDACIASSN